MNLNEEKSHRPISGHKHECYGQTSEGVKFANVKNKNFLELILMNIFIIQYKKSWQKAERVRICKFMTIERRRMLMITFAES